MITFEFDWLMRRLDLQQLIRTTRTYRPVLLCPHDPTLQLAKLPLILSLNPEE
jgi:hypothetical protein